MQKLIETQFFCYPKNKNLSILYANKGILKTRLFKALSLQVSPKEGVLLRIRKTNLGHQLSTLNKKNIVSLYVPENKNLKLGYNNNNKIIFFEFDKNDTPIKILKSNNSLVFEEFNFLGYSIIEGYTKSEYFNKRNYIKKALEKRWKEINQNEILHGDFTHFNVLLSQENELCFIDAKKVDNSILFDHFYFYSYFVQCLEKCQTISNDDVSEIKIDLQKIIFGICKIGATKKELTAINIKDAVGIMSSERDSKLIEFSKFLLRNEK